MVKNTVNSWIATDWCWWTGQKWEWWTDLEWFTGLNLPQCLEHNELNNCKKTLNHCRKGRIESISGRGTAPVQVANHYLSQTDRDTNNLQLPATWLMQSLTQHGHASNFTRIRNEESTVKSKLLCVWCVRQVVDCQLSGRNYYISIVIQVQQKFQNK